MIIMDIITEMIANSFINVIIFLVVSTYVVFWYISVVDSTFGTEETGKGKFISVTREITTKDMWKGMIWPLFAIKLLVANMLMLLHETFRFLCLLIGFNFDILPTAKAGGFLQLDGNALPQEYSWLH